MSRILSFTRLAGVLLAMGSLASVATAAHLTYATVDFDALNGSNVEGNAVLIVDSTAKTLQVQVQVSNLEPNQDHVFHIHGRFNGAGDPIDSVNPTLADDTDGDGYIEVLEGAASYGDILLTLGTLNTPTGTAVFDQTFDLTDDSQFMSGVTGNDYVAADIFPLMLREIVIHGQTVATGEGRGTSGEVDGTGGYKAVLPVSAGEIIGIPEPATLGLLGVALVAAGIARRQR